MERKDINSFSDLIHALIEQGYGSLTIEEVLDVMEQAKKEMEEGQV